MLSYTALAVTVAEADAYILSRAYIGWAGDATAKTAALRRGQDFIANTYNQQWVVTFTDATAPDSVKYAIIEAARREALLPGSLAPDWNPATVVSRKRVKAGPVESESEFVANEGAPCMEP